MASISDLRFDDLNFNAHSERGMSLLEKSLQKHGAGRSILIDKNNNIIGGNGVVEAAGNIGLEDVQIVESDGTKIIAVKRTDIDLNTPEGRDMAMADNATASADLVWAKDNISEAAEKFGIDPGEWDIDGWNDTTEEIEEDEAPEVDESEPAKSELGKVYKLGNHRLMCGDSTKEEDIISLMNGDKAEICFTSPPYNAGSIDKKGQNYTKPKYSSYNDNLKSDEYFAFICKNVGLMLEHSEEVFYNIGLVEGNKREIIMLQNHYIDNFKDIIYWKKNTVVPHIAPGVINNLVEFILCFGDGKRKFKNAQFHQGTYWNVIEGNNANGNEYASIHKATFPLYLPMNIVENFSQKNSIVIDCFGGTGTTLIACEQLGRKCYMMELDPKYCDVIRKRYYKFTHDGDEEGWEEGTPAWGK